MSLFANSFGVFGDVDPRLYDNYDPDRVLSFQDDKCMVYSERNPLAPIHFMICAKKKWIQQETEDKVLGHLMLVARDIAIENGLNETGYHVVMDHNTQNGGQTLHLFGRALQHMLWPGSRL